MALCTASCKNGNACSYKAKKDGYCLVHYKEEPLECTICYESISQQFVLDCKHKFHKKCIASWIEMDKNTCPICRVVMSNETIEKTGAKPNKELVVLKKAELTLFQFTFDNNSIDERYIIVQDRIMDLLVREMQLRIEIQVFIQKRMPNNVQEKILNKESKKIKLWIDEFKTHPRDFDYLDSMAHNVRRLIDFEVI